MAPTSDERREVAARLRSCVQNVNGTRDLMYLGHLVGFDGVTDDEGKHFTIAADRREAELTLERLADLIDPICEDEGTITQDWPDGSATYLHELSCGHTCETIYAGAPAFCPYCGARVVDDERRGDAV